MEKERERVRERMTGRDFEIERKKRHSERGER